MHRGVEEQARQKEGPFRPEGVDGRQLEVALLEEHQVGLVDQSGQVVGVAIIRYGAGGVRQKGQFALLVVIRRLKLAIGGGGVAPRAGEDRAQFLADIPTRAIHEQDAGKRLEQVRADGDRLQFVPKHGVQTVAEKGGRRGRKALM